MLQQVLNTHPEVHCFHEYGLSTITSLIDAIFERGRAQPEGYHKLQVRAAVGVPKMPVAADTLDAFEIARTNATVRAIGDVIPVPKEGLHRDRITRAIFEIISGKADLKIVADKMPYRIDGVAYDNPADRYPGTKTVVVLRRPDHVIASSLRRTKATLEGKDDWYVKDVDTAIEEWKRATRATLAWLQEKPDLVHIIKYENLCSNFSAESGALANFLGLENKFANLVAPTPDSLLSPLDREAEKAVRANFDDVIKAWDKLDITDLQRLVD